MKKVLAIFLMVLMCASVLALVASADNDSPNGDDNYTVDVSSNQGGSATSTATVVSKNGVTTITAINETGYEFTSWTITGEFEWVKGDINSPVIEIRPLGDVTFVANFKKISSEEGGKKDDGKKSPATGYDMAPVIVVMTVVLSVSAAAVAVTGKRYFTGK